MEHARQANEHGVGVICNLLGEHYDERAPAEADAVAYGRLIANIGNSGLRACVSVKPSQLGLLVGEGVFRANLRRTAADLERLADCPGRVRLVKGAYDPPGSVAYTERSRVDDPEMLTLAAALHANHGTPTRSRC